MADIKAKDIAVAQSVGANDLILGSSIAGTTANVRVDTIGNHLINSLTYNSLNNKTLAQIINELEAKYNTTTIDIEPDRQYMPSGRIAYKYNAFMGALFFYDAKFAATANAKKIAEIPYGIRFGLPVDYTYFPLMLDGNGAVLASIRSRYGSLFLHAPQDNFADKYLDGYMIYMK